MNKQEIDNSSDDLTKRPPEQIVEPIPEEQLIQEAKLRAKKRPLLEKIIKLLKRENEPYREIVINVEPFEKRMALLEEGIMQKFEIERNGEESMVGAIFKGKIQNLEPGLKAAFVDIGQQKNAFLHYWDIFPTSTDNSYEVVRENRSKEQKKLATALKTASARYDKELKEIEAELKRRTENDADKEKYAAQIEKLEARKAACEEKIAKLKAFAKTADADAGEEVDKKDEKAEQKEKKDEKKEKKSKKK